MAEIPDAPDPIEGAPGGDTYGGPPPPPNIIPQMGGGGGSPFQSTAVSRYWGPQKRRMLMEQTMNAGPSPLQLQGYPMQNDTARQYQQFFQSSRVPYVGGAGRWA
jgi:hypothetical protein